MPSAGTLQISTATDTPLVALAGTRTIAGCTSAAITEEDIDEYVSHYSAPGGMRASFEYYRAFHIDMEQIKEYSKVKLLMPVLALGGEHMFGTAVLDSMKSLATDVRGGIVPLSGHWIPEEQPDFVIEQLVNFFGASNDTNVTK
jgi:pimeloyl-ACP methyl ester carboxylesterase